MIVETWRTSPHTIQDLCLGLRQVGNQWKQAATSSMQGLIQTSDHYKQIFGQELIHLIHSFTSERERADFASCYQYGLQTALSRVVRVTEIMTDVQMPLSKYDFLANPLARSIYQKNHRVPSIIYDTFNQNAAFEPRQIRNNHLSMVYQALLDVTEKNLGRKIKTDSAYHNLEQMMVQIASPDIAPDKQIALAQKALGIFLNPIRMPLPRNSQVYQKAFHSALEDDTCLTPKAHAVLRKMYQAKFWSLSDKVRFIVYHPDGMLAWQNLPSNLNAFFGEWDLAVKLAETVNIAALDYAEKRTDLIGKISRQIALWTQNKPGIRTGETSWATVAVAIMGLTGLVLPFFNAKPVAAMQNDDISNLLPGLDPADNHPSVSSPNPPVLPDPQVLNCRIVADKDIENAKNEMGGKNCSVKPDPKNSDVADVCCIVDPNNPSPQKTPVALPGPAANKQPVVPPEVADSIQRSFPDNSTSKSNLNISDIAYLAALSSIPIAGIALAIMRRRQGK